MTLNWPHVTDVFGGAIDRTDADRVAFLSEACSRNDALGMEVADLLMSYDQMGDFLGDPAVIIADAKKDDGSQNVGRKIGPYEIEAVLGEGGRGTAFLATDARQHRQVVLKKISAALGRDDVAREALLRDAKIVSSLQQPHIAAVHGVEEIYGEYYIVGEYVAGANLRGLVESGPADPRAIITIGRQVADALQAGHAHGINHNNLKPENIVFREGGSVSVLDYGLAHTPYLKANEAPPAGSDAVSVTIGYLSPEQLEGPSVDPRSDLFSLGVVLYELASGRNPFAAPAPAGTVSRIKTLQPPAVVAVREQIPAALDRVIMKCLEKDPEQRPPGAAALFESLKALEIYEPGAVGDAANRESGGFAAPGTSARSAAALAARSPWITHQMLVMGTMLAMAFLMWEVEASRSSIVSAAIAGAVALTAIISGMMRLQWLIQSSSDDLAPRLRRTMPLVIAVDLILGALLLLGGIDMSSQHFLLGMIVAVSGVCLAVAAVFVEPAKARAAFPTESL